MRYINAFVMGLVCLYFFVMPDRSFSEVRISLNNGREIIADKCTGSGNKLVCEKMGGSFEIDKNDVLETKGITIEHDPSKEASEADIKGAEKQPAEGLVKSLKPEEQRLEQINNKKIEYLAERQRLISDRQKLQEDVKRADLSYPPKIDAINKRIIELDARINKFNEDVRKLNEEEQKILESSQNNK